MNKTGALVLSCVVIAAVLLLGYDYTSAQPQADALASKIGVVSIRIVFRDCKANAAYRQKVLAEQSLKNAEMEALQKEIDAQQAGLKALKPGSPDYMKQYEQLLNKQAKYEATKQFLSQQWTLRDQRWTEELYKEILRITKELAKKKGLIMVLEVAEPEFPLANADELMMALQTHKVLYSDGCVDLTAEVVAELDKIQSQFKP